MKILLVYPPFCTPTIMPYSIANLKGSLNNVKCLDLNAKFHRMRFPVIYGSLDLNHFLKQSMPVYKKNNSLVLDGKRPELIDEMLDLISRESPDIVAFSLVYNSQNFYADALIDRLDCRIVLGGPAVSERLKQKAEYLQFEAMVKIAGRRNRIAQPDFSDFDERAYLTKQIVYPLRSSVGCPYKQCAFCNHHEGQKYEELPLMDMMDGNYFFIDDMVTTPRLKAIAGHMRNSRWWVQLRPTIDIVPILPRLAASGLHSVAWGVESGSQQVLDAMRKGTTVGEIEKVLMTSKECGIINTVYMMFGFPTETVDDFRTSISFLKRNEANIHLVSASMFGVMKGTSAYDSPDDFNIDAIHEKERRLLNPKLELISGSYEDIARLKKKFSKTLLSLNKYPKFYSVYKEQTLFL